MMLDQLINTRLVLRLLARVCRLVYFLSITFCCTEQRRAVVAAHHHINLLQVLTHPTAMFSSSQSREHLLFSPILILKSFCCTGVDRCTQQVTAQQVTCTKCTKAQTRAHPATTTKTTVCHQLHQLPHSFHQRTKSTFREQPC